MRLALALGLVCACSYAPPTSTRVATDDPNKVDTEADVRRLAAEKFAADHKVCEAGDAYVCWKLAQQVW